MRVLLCAALLLSVPSAALAQPSAVVVVQTEDPDAAARARSGMIEAMAERAVRLLPTPDGAPCEELECLRQLASTTGAEWVFSLEVGADEVVLEVVGPDGEPRELREPRDQRPLELIAGSLVERHLADGAAPAVGYVVVQSDPPGAAVSIDGRAAGRTPLRRALSPGAHEIVLRPSGGAAVTRTVLVEQGREATVDPAEARDPDEAPSADAPRAASASAGSASAGSASEDAPGTAPSPWNWALGGALAIGGIVALISPLRTLAQEGECVDRIEDVGCQERVSFGAQSGVLMGVGVALLAAAVIVDVVAPIRVEVSASASGAGARVGGWF